MEDITVGSVVVLRVPKPAPIHPDGGQSLVIAVVTKIYQHDERRWMNVIIAHSFHEMATDHDVFVHGVTPYTLVLMGEMYAQVWEAQIEKVLGQVPTEATIAAWIAIHDDGEKAAAWNTEHSKHGVPMPLAGPADPRWKWLEQWLPTATALSTPVRRVLLG